ncbi:hypothetical protein Sjap_018426 [Stephania japonica]|uniref:Uncharacterized protein n=1 Tax=Stephania japonica TaxID=461633 RepID=A0AAP0NN61_9MAGN
MITEAEQLKHLGFLGIFKESHNIIVSKWSCIFIKIFLALIFPFCLLTLTDMHISDFLLLKIMSNHINLDDTMSFYPSYKRIKRELALQWPLFGISNLLYFLVGLIVLYLFSISAISYAVNSIYASKDTTFKEVVRAAPKVWKKLVITFLWNFFIQFIPIFATLLAIFLVLGIIGGYAALAILICAIVFILFIAGFMYLNVIWSLASVVSVLEECYGLRAFKRSKDLMKGKKKLCIGIYMVFEVLLVIVQVLYLMLVGSFNSRSPIVAYATVPVFCFLLLVLVLLGLVAQTILYLVCKSHHHELNSRSSLGDQLDGHMGP